MKYLNKRDKDRVILLAAMVSQIEEIIEDILEHGGWATPLKYVRTYLYKYIDRQLAGLTQEQVAEIINRVSRREVGFYIK